MTRVLVHLVLHCVFSTRIGPLKVTRSACVCTHAQYVIHCMQCTSTMCKSGNSTYFTTPRCECTERAQVTFATYGEKNLKDDIYGMPGVKGQTLGVPGPDPARPTHCALFGPKVKGQKVCQNLPRTYYSCTVDCCIICIQGEYLVGRLTCSGQASLILCIAPSA